MREGKSKCDQEKEKCEEREAASRKGKGAMKKSIAMLLVLVMVVAAVSSAMATTASDALNSIGTATYPVVTSTSNESGTLTLNFNESVSPTGTDDYFVRVYGEFSGEEPETSYALSEDGKSLMVDYSGYDSISKIDYVIYNEANEWVEYGYYPTGAIASVYADQLIQQTEDNYTYQTLYNYQFSEDGSQQYAGTRNGQEYYTTGKTTLANGEEASYVQISSREGNTETGVFYVLNDTKSDIAGYSVWSGEETINEDGEYQYNTLYDVHFNADGTLDTGFSSYIQNVGYYDVAQGKWFDMNGEEIADPDLQAYRALAEGYKKNKEEEEKPKAVWYTNNTMGVVGISLRNEYPNLTKKWYNVLPVDLSKDGEQTFKLVASNLYYMGTVTVTVEGDNVTTTYNVPHYSWQEVYPGSECLAWFTGVEEITSDFLENPTSDMQFGTAISKENDLNGQDKALLFVCNRITYRIPLDNAGAMPVHYWPNHYKMADYFTNVKALFEQVEEQFAEKQAAENE